MVKFLVRSLRAVVGLFGIAIIRSSSLVELQRKSAELKKKKRITERRSVGPKTDNTIAEIEKNFLIDELASLKKVRRGEVTCRIIEVDQFKPDEKDQVLKVGKAPWTHSWRSYYYTNEKDIHARMESLCHGLDSTSVLEIETTLDRFINVVPPMDCQHDILVNANSYLNDREKSSSDVQKLTRIRAELARDHPEIEGLYLPAHVAVYHSGLTSLPKASQARLKGRDAIDGGALWGDSALLFNSYEPRRIYAFEPDETNYGQLCALKESIGLSSVVPCKYALGDTEMEVDFFSQERDMNIGASLIQTPTTRGSATKVAMTSIDRFLANETDPDIAFIKLDIEGNELEAIVGAQETIKEFRPALSIAIYHRANDFFEVKPYLASLNSKYRFAVRRYYSGVVFGLFLLAFETED